MRRMGKEDGGRRCNLAKIDIRSVYPPFNYLDILVSIKNEFKKCYRGKNCNASPRPEKKRL